MSSSDLATSLRAALRKGLRNTLRGVAPKEVMRAQTAIGMLRLVTPRDRIPELFEWVKAATVGKEAFRTVTGLKHLRKYRALHEVAPPPALDLNRELVWSTLVLSPHLAQLQQHVLLAEEFRKKMLAGDSTGALAVLDDLERKLGLSLWLIEARQLALHQQGGLERQQSYIEEVYKAAPASFAAFLAHYWGERNEDQTIMSAFASRFNSALAEWNLEEPLNDYLRYRVVGILPPSQERLANLIVHDGVVSIYDLYETLLCAAQAVVGLPDASELLMTLQALTSIRDERLASILVRVGLASSDLPRRDLRAEDAFWAGRYEEAAKWTADILAMAPQDAETRATHARLGALCGECDALEPAFDQEGDRLPTETIDLAKVWHAAARALFSSEKTSAQARSTLEKLAVNLRWGFGIPGALANSNELAQEILGPIAVTSALDPWAVLTMAHSAREAYLDACEAAYPQSLTVVAARLASGGIVSDEASSCLSREGRAMVSLIALLEQSAWDAALAQVKVLTDAPEEVLRRLGARIEVKCLIHLGQEAEVLERLTYWCIEDDDLFYLLPVEQQVGKFSAKALKPYMAHLWLPIALHLLLQAQQEDPKLKAKQVETTQAHLKWAVDEFLNRNGLNAPSDMAMALHRARFDLDQVVYFLRAALTPAVLEGCRKLKDQRLQDEERVSILLLLTELDPEHAANHLQEAKLMLANLKVEEGVELLDRTRIYVDLDALSRWAHRKLREEYERYCAKLAAGLVEPGFQFTEAIVEAFKTQRPVPRKFLEVPNEEGDDILVRLALALHQQYLMNEDHGLDYFLSSRIRHGTLATTLRGPLEVRKLITTRPSVAESYRTNEYWLQRIPDLTHVEQDMVNDAFAAFSEGYDKIADELIRPRLHVRDESFPHGLFARELHGPTLQALKEVALDGDSLDDFLTLAYVHFATQLKQELVQGRAVVQAALGRADELFARLRAVLSTIPAAAQCTELNAALATTFTDVQATFSQVEAWLQLDAPQDALRAFTMRQALDAAVAFALRTQRGFDPVLTINTDHVHADRQLGTNTFSEIADIVSIALQNVQHNSGVAGRPHVVIRMRDDSPPSMLLLEFESQVADGIYNESVEERLADIRERIDTGAYRGEIRKEGGSGFLKLKRTVSLYGNHLLKFGFPTPDRFLLSVGMTLHDLQDGRSEVLPDMMSA